MSFSKFIGSRVDQLDAHELDDQLFSVFKEQLTTTFKYVDSNNFLSFWSFEIDALIKASLLSVLLLRHATIGQDLLNLTIKDSKGTALKAWKASALFLLLTGTKWFRERCLVNVLNVFLRDRIRSERYATLTEAFVRLAGVANFYVFLTQNRYPNILFRLFGVRLTYPEKPNIRQIDYDTMSRELLWTTCAEFLAFIVPFINSSRSRSLFRNALDRMFGKREDRKSTKPSERTVVDFRSCGICAKAPTQPHEIGCKHVFCYVCITSNVLSDDNYECPLCGQLADGVKNVKPARCLGNRAH